MPATAIRPTPAQKQTKQTLKRLQRAANDNVHGAQNTATAPGGQPSPEMTQRIQQQYAHDQEMQNMRMIQAQQRATENTAQARRSPSKKQQKKCTEAKEAYKKTKFTLLYASGALSDILSLFYFGFWLLYKNTLEMLEVVGNFANIISSGAIVAACVTAAAGTGVISAVVGAFTAGLGAVAVGGISCVFGGAFAWLRGKAIRESATYVGTAIVLHSLGISSFAELKSLLIFMNIFMMCAFAFPAVIIWIRCKTRTQKIALIISAILKQIPLLNILPLSTINTLIFQLAMKKEIRKKCTEIGQK